MTNLKFFCCKNYFLDLINIKTKTLKTFFDNFFLWILICIHKNLKLFLTKIHEKQQEFWYFTEFADNVSFGIGLHVRTMEIKLNWVVFCLQAWKSEKTTSEKSEKRALREFFKFSLASPQEKLQPLFHVKFET